MRALGLKVDENNLSSGYILSGDDEAIKGFIKLPSEGFYNIEKI